MEPTSASVTPPAGAGDRATCLRGSPSTFCQEMRFALCLLLLLTGLHSSAHGDHPVTHQQKLEGVQIVAWTVGHWRHYSGIYEALEVDGTGGSRVILTAFSGAKGAELISACVITVSDTFVEPSYQIHGSISPDETTGRLEGYSINDWKMIRYVDPNTRETVFGISIDGRIFVDRSKKTPRAEPGAAGQPAPRSESK